MIKCILCFLVCMLITGCASTAVPSTAVSSTAVPSTTASGISEESTGADATQLPQYKSSARVLCYNVFCLDVARRAENIQDLIVENDPDVLLLQEVSLAWIPYLQEFMDENSYSYYGYGRYGEEMSSPVQQEWDEYMPILWKTEKYDMVQCGHFWLSSTPDVFSSDWVDGTTSNYPRCVNWVILKDKATGDEIMVLNIHTDPESEMVRLYSCNLTLEMMKKLRGDRPCVLGGDWNMDLLSTGYNLITCSGYKDLRVHAQDTHMGGSYNAWGGKEDGKLGYADHIFVSADMDADLFRVVDDYYDGAHISDHNPLLAVVYYGR